MKRRTILLLFLIPALNLSAQTGTDTIISNNPQNLKLKILYFHITHRCNTCFNIESYVRQTLDSGFAKQMELGFIDLYILNCELPENKELVEKYEAYGATLAITSYSNGKEGETEDLTNWAFQKVSTPVLFKEMLTTKINNLLKP